MFKIRSLQIDDFKRFKEIIPNKSHVVAIHKLPLREFAYLIQNLIPHNLRSFPSIHIAVDENNILGYVILRSLSKPNNSWQIDEVFVPDEIRNEGVGEELLRYVLSVYGGHGVEHFLAEIDSQNTPALSLFHQCGFRRYAKVSFYEREIDTTTVETLHATTVETLHATSLRHGKDFILRPQTNNDLTELEKLEISSIPPDLRPALGKSREYFRQKKDSIVVIDKSRGLIIGWGNIQKQSEENYIIELLANPGWTHLYEQFLNTIISDYIPIQTNKFTLTVKAIDYLTELTEVLKKAGFLPVEIKELLVRTVWQKIRERKAQTSKVGRPSIAPT
ncbi:MAG: hypothetical protein A3I68_04755 [Candidatus Melainabacteria bacterium RIFCSPLOWO2_02_FULL_35_15]|nr:MAG: hypothetical protein A3I68_04755 [Candidatus Melainabacteria bacterium RIFCSPLOWO2_02_FULL_35_15]